MSAPGDDSLVAFVVERHQIYRRRAAGGSRPWTADSVLQQYRFCNVYRELDTVTKWIADHWRTPHADDPDLWFAMCVVRFVNWPDTLKDLGYPIPWDPDRFVAVLGARRRTKMKVYSSAYMIRSDARYRGVPKEEYQAHTTLSPLWANREALRPRPSDTLNSYHMMLGGLFGFGSFMAAQVVADVKYVQPLWDADDWWTFAASGPGSRRGLNRVLGRPKTAPWREDEWRMELARLIDRCSGRLTEAGMTRLHAQDWQNCLCEFDKYERVRLGEGRPRQRFRGLP